MKPVKRQFLVFHDITCKSQALAIRQALELKGSQCCQEGSGKDVLLVVVYRSAAGYEEAMGPVRKLSSQYPVLAIPVERDIQVKSADPVVFVPYDFDMIEQTIKMLPQLIPLKMPKYWAARCWMVFLAFLLIVMSVAPVVHLYSSSSYNFGMVDLIFAGIVYLLSYAALMIYLISCSQRLRQQVSIDQLKLCIPTLTDPAQKNKANERLLNFYLEETEK